MIRFITKSNAVYWFDATNSRLMREVGGMGPGLDLPNEEWHYVTSHSPIEIGVSVHFNLERDQFRLTTPVVHIEEIP